MPFLKVLATNQITKIEEVPFRIGRSQSCHLHLPDQSVSRNHAEIVVRNKEFYLETRSTTSPTMVDGIEVPTECSLGNSCHIEFGSVKVQWSLDAFQEDTPAETSLDEIFIPQEDARSTLIPMGKPGSPVVWAEGPLAEKYLMIVSLGEKHQDIGSFLEYLHRIKCTGRIVFTAPNRTSYGPAEMAMRMGEIIWAKVDGLQDEEALQAIGIRTYQFAEVFREEHAGEPVGPFMPLLMEVCRVSDEHNSLLNDPRVLAALRFRGITLPPARSS